jgi:signal transduction histidine kinase
LVGLNGFIHELEESTKLTSNQKELVSNISSCVQSISGLITNLLDFSLIDSQKLVLKRELWNITNR